VAPDLAADDKIYIVSVIFPDTSAQNVKYKFLYNDQYEGVPMENRFFSIDPDNHDAVGNPQILPVDVFDPVGISGVYFYRLEVGIESITKRMVMLK